MLLDSMSKTVASCVRLDPDLIWHRQPRCLLQQKRNDDLVNGSLTRQLNSQRSVDNGGGVMWANYFKEHTCLNESSWHLLKCCQDSLIKCLSWCLGVRWNPGNKSRPISSSRAVVNSNSFTNVCAHSSSQAVWFYDGLEAFLLNAQDYSRLVISPHAVIPQLGSAPLHLPGSLQFDFISELLR